MTPRSFSVVSKAPAAVWLVCSKRSWISFVFSDCVCVCVAELSAPFAMIPIAICVLSIVLDIWDKSFLTCVNCASTSFTIVSTSFATCNCFSAFTFTASVSSLENSIRRLIALHPPNTHMIRQIHTRKTVFNCSALSAGLFTRIWAILVIINTKVAPAPHMIRNSFKYTDNESKTGKISIITVGFCK